MVHYRPFSPLPGDKVLCLDGGGIRGLVQLEILRTIEELTHRKIVDLFDWIVGTSTGGILALGMVYGELISHVENLLNRVAHQRSDTVYSRTVFLGVHNSVVHLL